MVVRATTVVANSNHDVQNLRGWSLNGTFVVNLRQGAVDGQILATVTNSSHELFGDNIDATGGTYVEQVSGSVSGVLYS
jgi:hypothetical protein